ncbi:MATE family efflux transporter [Lachnospiraceae bacterium ZAX-1]
MFSNKTLFKLILPLIFEQLLAMSVGIVDTAMVSSLGEAAVSGVSLVDMINQLMISIFAALATGGAVVTAQYIGHKENKKACQSASQLMLIAVCISIFIMGLCLLLHRPILKLVFGTIDATVMNNAVIYLVISALSYPFLALYNCGASLFRAMGNSKISLQVSILMNIVNVIFNSIFIFAMHMGVAGAAYGSLISRAVAAIVIVLMLRSHKNIVHFIKFQWPFFQKDMGKKILYIGVPNGLENGMFQLGRILVVSIISTFGTTQIAANAVANNLDALGIIPGSALGLAMITVIGQCVGAGDYEQVEYYTKKILKATYITMAAVVGVILLTLPYILQIYSLSDETLNLSMTLVRIHNGCAIFFWPMAFVLPNALRASNDVRFTMYVTTLSMCLFRILFSLILGRWLGLGAIGVWIAMVLDWIFRASLFAYRFLSKKWQKIKLI